LDSLVELLLESPYRLAILCALGCLVLLVLWRRTLSAARRKAFLAGVSVSAILLLLQAIVVTDRERIIALMNGLAEAVIEPDFERIERAIDPEYDDGRRTKSALMALIRDRLSGTTVERARLYGFEVDVRGERATTRFRAMSSGRVGDTPVVNIPSAWQVDLIRRGRQWTITAIRPTRVNLRDAGDLDDVR